ncbi:aminotransferase class III-fold pyridoxal phosphate-dependent enzyme [Mesorhizobium sp. ES1-3]|uniref:aminotransferase class III-fold pyridoxal phosphate-dependent enzyme n=1 Tax=Mesorhizobium sp. ES1-3 TaxID=2876628 RepID=UPI001CCC636E|nr:aminotransferase class III-fold pyridoxal phosphate-dependent enzyme [Mesorhizobium sp. ES1-3]MBZ9669051.1 aminotransferase class III-fold pyridoxal phosphate-dependent enzyme [Mesorhizobium sp. ES1-3]
MDRQSVKISGNRHRIHNSHRRWTDNICSRNGSDIERLPGNRHSQIRRQGRRHGIPLRAVIAKRAVAKSVADKFLFHTYGANPVACAAGRAVLKVMREERLQENAATVGSALKERLQLLRKEFPLIGDIRGQA